jgi:hypothetical protein
MCGHTHYPEAPLQSEPAGCAYYNTGCWTDHTCHYVTVLDGCLQLLEANAEAPAETMAGSLAVR